MTNNQKTNKLYCEKVELDDEVKAFITQCCKNHLVFYNEVLEYFRHNKTIGYQELKSFAAELLDSGKYGTVVKDILFNDIYYMHKRHDFKQKLLTGIQYLTVIVTDYNSRNTNYNKDNQTLSFKASEGFIHLPKPLPPIDEGGNVYLNLSYSGGSGTFEVSVFRM